MEILIEAVRIFTKNCVLECFNF